MAIDNQDGRRGRYDDRIVPVGFLTARDLDVLGTGFDRIYRVGDDHAFDDLLARIDVLTPDGQGPGQRR